MKDTCIDFLPCSKPSFLKANRSLVEIHIQIQETT